MIATKGAVIFIMSPHASIHRISPHLCRRESLKRLGTDHIDLYQLHNPPFSVIEAAGVFDPLEKLKAKGKSVTTDLHSCAAGKGSWP